jgi:hypothetical protein
MTMAPRTRRGVDIVGLMAFVAVAAICFFVSLSAGLRAFAAWMMLTALVQHLTGQLPFGWQGPAPSRRTAAILNLTVGLAGLAILIWTDHIIDLFF